METCWNIVIFLVALGLLHYQTSSFKPKEAARGAFFHVMLRVKLFNSSYLVESCWCFMDTLLPANPWALMYTSCIVSGGWNSICSFEEELTYRHYVRKHYCLYWSLCNHHPLFTQPCCRAVNTQPAVISESSTGIIKGASCFWWTALDLHFSSTTCSAAEQTE